MQTAVISTTKKEAKLAAVKKGPGVFVYDGSAMDSHFEPGVQATDIHGSKLYTMDDSGVLPKRVPIWVEGKEPWSKKIPISTRVVHGLEFPTGKPVLVEDPKTAFKLRCLSEFSEVEGDEAVASAESAKAAPAPVKRGRGRPRKSEGEIAEE